MNNAFVGKLENGDQPDFLPMLRAKRERYEKIITAIAAIGNSPSWKILKEELFDGLTESIQKKLAKEKDEKVIFHLQGEFAVAEKYSNFEKFAEMFRKELVAIDKQLQKYA